MDKTTTWMIRAACGVVIAIPSLLVLGWISDAVLVQPRLQEEQRLREQQRAKRAAQYSAITDALEAIELAESGVGLTKAKAEQLLQEACDAHNGDHEACE